MTPTLAPRLDSRSPGTSASSSRGAPLTVLLVHNFYQKQGGEDGVFEREGGMLRENGNRVLEYTLHNDDVGDLGKLSLLKRTLWSDESYRRVKSIVEDENVDVVHVHNTLPLMSPSVFHGAHDGGAATVHSLHNYRLVCPGNLLFRDGKPCRDCVGTSLFLPSIAHACYRDSHTATAAVAGTISYHRRKGTWDRAVDRYIALSEFAKAIFIEGGLPGDRIAVKHNAPGVESGILSGGRSVLSVGRLATGKGLGVLLNAWENAPDLPDLVIAGGGPLAPLVEAASRKDSRIQWLGWQSASEVDRLMGEAMALVMPAMSYEGWPLVVIEAMGRGTPIIATDHGVFPEMIEDGVTGRLFPFGDSAALADSVRKLAEGVRTGQSMREATWATFQRRYAREVNYERLAQIYRDAIGEFAAARVP
ncbi:glycosyltransferase family 4 protein [Rubrivirga sp.]|uniref:glycosyltransferase family 4 protein n=1 Tax=Rubrivirga sp. TaxID=1885344 RepID=UPI003C767F4F